MLVAESSSDYIGFFQEKWPLFNACRLKKEKISLEQELKQREDKVKAEDEERKILGILVSAALILR